MVQLRTDVVGLDASVLSPPAVWEASGHLQNFTDPLVDCRNCKERFRQDHLIDVDVCPSCGAKVEKEADTPYIRCVNPECPAQFRERLKWFVGRNQMDIENVGEALIDQLADAGWVKTFADLYRITRDQLLSLERMGEKCISQ